MVVFVVRTGGTGASERPPQTTRSHYVLGLVGLLVAVASVALAYSTLVSLASAVPLLSTTVVVFVTVVTWVAVWLALDAVHERYVRRREID